MAGSFPKTIHFYDSIQSDEDSFELIELMILCTNFLSMGRIDDADAEVTFIIETLNDARNKNNKISNSKVEDDKETTLEVKKCLDTSSWVTQLLIQLSQMDPFFNNENDHWELSLDIDDFDLHLTPVLLPSSSTRVKSSPSTSILVRIILGPAGIVQTDKLLKQNDMLLVLDGAVMSTQEYMKKVVEDVGEDKDFKSGSWVSATDYVNVNGGTVSRCLGDIKNFLKNGKLDQVIAIVKSCSSNVIGDLIVTMKDLSGTIPGTIHHKVIGEGGYDKDITVGAALILANVSVFLLKHQCIT
ncbi:hypothetical protein Tco_0524210 [Tanacetum coccineum]